jgi:hypothetical protein
MNGPHSGPFFLGGRMAKAAIVFHDGNPVFIAGKYGKPSPNEKMKPHEKLRAQFCAPH